MRSATPTPRISPLVPVIRSRKSLAVHPRLASANHARRAPSENCFPKVVRVVDIPAKVLVQTQTCQQAKSSGARISPGSFRKLAAVEWLASMAPFSERVAHALVTRKKKPTDLDRYLAERFQKKGSGTGYTHRLLKRDQKPSPEVLTAIADFLDVSLVWLAQGQGPMGREEHQPTATYDSLTGWAEAAAAEVERGRVQAYAIRAAGRSPTFVRPAAVTPDFVFRAAMFWLSEAPEDDRRAALEAEARRIKAEEDALRRH